MTTLSTHSELQAWINQTAIADVYYGSGSSVYVEHFTVYQNRYEIIATYYPNGNHYNCSKTVKIFQKP